MSTDHATGGAAAPAGRRARARQPTIGVLGVGATGARAARQLAAVDEVGTVVLGGPGERPAALRRSLGDAARVADPFEAGARLIVLAGPAGTQLPAAGRAVELGIDVVSVSDDLEEVEGLLELDPLARDRGVRVVVGAGFAPGMSCVLARHLAGWMDHVTEIHLSRFGTGGPACARQHHRALAGRTVDWRDGVWHRRTSGSGRELSVFPDPVGSLDCYRAALPDALLLHPAFDEVQRIKARQAANRRQRLTAWLPMLRRPHPEGRIGAIRVEVRGERDGTSVTEVAGVIDRPAVAAGAVAGLAARAVLADRYRPGAFGLAEQVEPVGFLQGLGEHGVRAAVFVGVT